MPTLSRRMFVGGGLAVAGAGALSFRTTAQVRDPIPARRFFDSLGIGTHPNWRDTVWGRSDWQSEILQSGVKYIRGQVGRRDIGQAAIADLRPLFANGVKICVPVAHYRGRHFDLEATSDGLDLLASKVGAENLCGIESANEYNAPSRRAGDWAPRLRRFQAWLHDSVRRNRAFDSVPLIAPSIWGRRTEDYAALGNLEPRIDRGCIHYYTGGLRPTLWLRKGDRKRDTPDRSLAEALSDARMVAPTRRLWMTEFGYAVKGPGSGGIDEVSETAAAKYLVRGLFDIFAEGVEKIFLYNLLDDPGSPPRYHGLVDSGFRRRPAFDAVRNLAALFAEEGSAPNRSVPNYRLAGLTPDMSHHIFSRSDGALLLVFTRDVDSFDPVHGDLDVAPIAVELGLDRTARIELYDPVRSPNPVLTYRGVDRMTVPVGDSAVVVKITD